MVKDPTIKAIQGAARAKPLPGRSAAFKWLHDRHKELAQVIGRDRPGWATIQEHVHAAGVLGKNGQKLSVVSLIQIWERVCRDVEQQAAAKPTMRRSSRCSPKAKHPPKEIETPAMRTPQVGNSPSFASSHVTKESPRHSFAEVPDSALPLPKVPSCVIPPNETPEERIARNQRLLDEQFRRTDAWMGMPVTRKKP